MGLEQIVPTFFLIAVLILILPKFIKSNSKSKQFIINLFIWSIIVVLVMIVSYLSWYEKNKLSNNRLHGADGSTDY